MTRNDYQSYPLVDTAVGTRLLLGFIADATAIQRRLPPPWRIASLPAFEAVGLPTEYQPNLLLAFHHLLLDQDPQGQTLTDAGSRFLVLDIPACHPDSGERGLVHFQMFTGGAIPGRYRDALPAQVTHDYHVVEDSASTSTREAYQVQPEAGGLIEVQLTSHRGPLLRQTASSPNFPLWAAADPTIIRIYQEDSVMELLRNDFTGFNRVQDLTLRVTVPALADLFDGNERLVAIIGNPHYMRRVFSPRSETASRE
ncbi:hypothetical protein [Ktedonobacter racemifer]|uniref:Acetoacetate decarboxylase n=1 Tax=Ktedonobacter racemifer DSM 44963 TaxID=485913 RepID=D6U2P2_KTERA|nr:hypothetical protein [Ktedonobacter racemifer]EFH81006.1 hypothetical protein Krac_1661 [Ktedonobacter racemifer DSM 44963]